MSFRRIPFQFSSTDPVERQRELEKRFGLPSRNKMYVDNTNPLSMGSAFKNSGACSSPRLQHRVPIFVDGYDHPTRSSVDSNSGSENKKPNVRVIPIEVERGETHPSTRHRTFSGPAGFVKECNEEDLPSRDDASPLKRSMQDLAKPTKMKATTGPKVYNIPIKVEGADYVKKNSSKSPLKTKTPVQKVDPKVNGYNESKQIKEAKSDSEQTSKHEICKEQKMEININNAMTKIENVLQELKSYESGVKEFSGTVKDKQYRYLDEMLTRCMLRLDDIDTMGNEKVRSSRKNAVKQVQTCIDMLEEKMNSVKEIERVSENEVKDENTVLEEENLKEHQEATGVLTQVSEVWDHVDKTVVNDIEMVDVANSVTRVNESVQGTQVIKSESSPDASLCASETEASKKLDDSKVKRSKISELSDVDMVEVIVNPDSEDGKPDERSKEIKSVKEGSHIQLSSINAPEKPDDSKVYMSGEVETTEAILQDENKLEVDMPEYPKESCSGTEIPFAVVLQKSDVEMSEVENMLKEIKDRTLHSELQTIPDKEKRVTTGTDTSAAEQCETQLDSQDPISSQ